jgi:hypothetical protein
MLLQMQQQKREMAFVMQMQHQYQREQQYLRIDHINPHLPSRQLCRRLPRPRRDYPTTSFAVRFVFRSAFDAYESYHGWGHDHDSSV